LLGEQLDGAHPKLAYFCSAPLAGFYAAVDTKSVDFGGQQGKFRLMEKLCIKDWPGKTFEGASPDTHPALWHMLDVAAVAGVLLAQRSLTGNEVQDKALQFLIALHDLGKFSESFRAMLRNRPYSGARHWQHSYTLMNYLLDDDIAALIGGDEATRTVLYAAVAGHHGGPPEDLDRRELLNSRRQIGTGRAAAKAALAALAPLFGGAYLAGLQDVDALSWALSGLTVQADWIGSNAAWFPPQPADMTPQEYFIGAQERAEKAVAAAGLFSGTPRPTADILGGLPISSSYVIPHV
ncbi:MAG: CRISPR-associated endonuclease Cas3'', partial [Paracoccaceae bacterium]